MPVTITSTRRGTRGRKRQFRFRGFTINLRISFRLDFALLAALLVAGALASACAPVEQAEAVEVTAAPRQIARAAGPTKFARLVPTSTPTPTDTPLPTATPTRAPTDTPAPTRAPTTAATKAPTKALVSAMAAGASPTGAISPTAAAPGACNPIPEEQYTAFSLNSPPTDRPAEIHADLNLGLRGYAGTVEYTGLIDLDGATDPGAPQLDGLFADRRLPNSRRVFKVYDWNWGTNSRSGLIAYPPVTMVSVAVNPGETIHVPDADTDIGLGFTALVLYAAPTRITIKYTGEDNVQRGYTLQLENVCVEPRLLALYRQLNDAGRGQLPAVRAFQAIGRASTGELGIAIRDSGEFLDPRSRKDWWRGH